MNEVVKQLTSRKFLLAMSSTFGLLAAKQYREAVVVVLGYFGINGFAATR